MFSFGCKKLLSGLTLRTRDCTVFSRTCRNARIVLDEAHKKSRDEPKAKKSNKKGKARG